MLSNFRVLDLTEEIGFIAGKIFADLGAEVIKVEKPGGCSGRNISPFFGSVPDVERSLYWFAYNTGKKGITLDIESETGRDIFKILLVKSDIVLESYSPGYLENLGIGYKSCSQTRPGIIMTSITPYGQTGPYCNYRAYDLQCQAMSGTTNICGFPGEAPLRCGGEQAYVQAGIQAAVGTILALFYRETTREGQHVDVSVREAMTALTTIYGPVNDLLEAGQMKNRQGSCEDIDKHIHRWFYRCKDGYIIWLIQLGVMGHATNMLMQWMVEEGMADILKKEIGDWSKIQLDDVTQSQLTKWEGEFACFFLAHTKEELLDGAVRRRIMLHPVSNMAEVIANPQLRARDYWVNLEHQELNTNIMYPGTFFKTSEAHPQIKSRAPFIGEHNKEIYETELGFSPAQVEMLREANVI